MVKGDGSKIVALSGKRTDVKPATMVKRDGSKMTVALSQVREPM